MKESKVFVRISSDLSIQDNLKDIKVWKIVIHCSDTSNTLYIETQLTGISDKVPEEIYMNRLNKSYFRGITNVDTNIGKIFKDDNDKELDGSVNIYSNDDEHIVEKMNKFLHDNISKDTDLIEIIFKNSFEEVLFYNFFHDKFEKFDKEVLSLNIGSSMIMSEKDYDVILTNYMKESFKDAKTDEEKFIFDKLSLIIETLVLRDYFDYSYKEIINGGTK